MSADTRVKPRQESRTTFPIPPDVPEHDAAGVRAFAHATDDTADDWASSTHEATLDTGTIDPQALDEERAYYRGFVRSADTALYSVWCEQWTQAIQIRWTMLYYFLGAATLMALAWSALFAGPLGVRASRPALIAVSAAGFLISLLWLLMSNRSNGFVSLYARHAREAEGDRFGPFTAAATHGEHAQRVIGWIRTGHVVIAVPVVFVLLFMFLMVMSSTAGSTA